MQREEDLLFLAFDEADEDLLIAAVAVFFLTAADFEANFVAMIFPIVQVFSTFKDAA